MFSCAKEIFFFPLIFEESYMNTADIVSSEPDIIMLHTCKFLKSNLFIYLLYEIKCLYSTLDKYTVFKELEKHLSFLTTLYRLILL